MSVGNFAKETGFAPQGVYLAVAGTAAGVVIGLDGDDLVISASDPTPGPANTAHAPLADRDLRADAQVIGGAGSGAKPGAAMA